jgi:hypothetical protein
VRKGARRLAFFGALSVATTLGSGCYAAKCKSSERGDQRDAAVRSLSAGNPRCDANDDLIETDEGVDSSGDDDAGTSGEGPDLGGGTG